MPKWYRDGAGKTVEDNSSIFSLILMRLLLLEGMWAVKLPSNEILRFLTEGVPAIAGFPV